MNTWPDIDLNSPGITTERLYIRKLTLADTSAIYEIFSNPEVTRYWGLPMMRSREEARKFIDESAKGLENKSLLQWGVVHKESGQLIGTCAFASWEPEHQRAEIGFALGRNSWKRGFMTELLPAFIQFGFDKMKLHRIEADVDPENSAAIKLVKKMGFSREGHLKDRYCMDGKYRDSLIFGLLRTD